jgi:hypothetical protein
VRLTPQRPPGDKRGVGAAEDDAYYNGVQPRFTRSKGSSYTVEARSAAAGGARRARRHRRRDRGHTGDLRADLDAPVLDIQTETDVTDVLSSYAARQPDGDRSRLWGVAGTAHVDQHLLGSSASYVDCGMPINDGPMHLVAKAALRALTTWIETGAVPTIAADIDVTSGAIHQIRRDADGIALGGVCSPPVDVPVTVLSGEPGPNPSMICSLLGSTMPFSEARLAQLYPSRSSYLQRYNDHADATIKTGFVLPEDRGALLAFAEPHRIAT